MRGQNSPDFQTKLRDSITKRIALDRIMVGFNGKSRADTSNPAVNKNLEDINTGWLENPHQCPPARHVRTGRHPRQNHRGRGA